MNFVAPFMGSTWQYGYPISTHLAAWRQTLARAPLSLCPAGPPSSQHMRNSAMSLPDFSHDSSRCWRCALYFSAMP
eukprot:2695726-Pyramimonas_sp.AAC.1